MIKLTSVKKNFGHVEVLKDISIEINEGEIYGLIGHSGAGKSTLLRCINGLESYDDGSVNVMGKEIKNLNKNEFYNLLGINDISFDKGVLKRKIESLTIDKYDNRVLLDNEYIITVDNEIMIDGNNNIKSNKLIIV